MSDSDNLLKIFDKMSEIREDVGILRTEVTHLKEDQGQIRVELEGIKEQDMEQNRLLDKHILGVETAMAAIALEKDTREAQIAALNKRLEDAEFLPNLMKSLKKALVWTAGLLAAVGAIGKFFHWF